MRKGKIGGRGIGMRTDGKGRERRVKGDRERNNKKGDVKKME